MKIESPLMERIHLDPGYALLSLQNIITTMELFNCLDIHRKKSLNDIQFRFFMKQTTDMSSHSEIQIIFNLLDVDQSGDMEFDEFYLLFCIMVACKDQYEKEFISRHSSSIFQLIDQDSSHYISRDEFANMGILFNFDKRAILSIFNEFDISGDKHLDFREFRLFTMACIDEQRGLEARKKVEAFRQYNQRLIENLTPTIKRYLQTRNLPPPLEVEVAVDAVEPPYITRLRYRKDWRSRFWDQLHHCHHRFLRGMRRCWRACRPRKNRFRVTHHEPTGISAMRKKYKRLYEQKLADSIKEDKAKKKAACGCFRCCWRRKRKDKSPGEPRKIGGTGGKLKTSVAGRGSPNPLLTQSHVSFVSIDSRRKNDTIVVTRDGTYTDGRHQSHSQTVDSSDRKKSGQGSKGQTVDQRKSEPRPSSGRSFSAKKFD